MPNASKDTLHRQLASQPSGTIKSGGGGGGGDRKSWFLSSPFIIRVTFFLPFGFCKGALK